MNYETFRARRSGRALTIQIDRLFLRGVPACELESAAAEFRHELMRLIGEHGPPGETPDGRNCAIHLSGAESLRAGAGVRAARALYARWRGDASPTHAERKL